MVDKEYTTLGELRAQRDPAEILEALQKPLKITKADLLRCPLCSKCDFKPTQRADEFFCQTPECSSSYVLGEYHPESGRDYRWTLVETSEQCTDRAERTRKVEGVVENLEPWQRELIGI